MSDEPMIPETDLNEQAPTNAPDTSDEAEAPLDNSRADLDRLLQELVAYADHWGVNTSITLNLGGSMVSGEIISTREYVEKFAVQYQKQFANVPEAAEAMTKLILWFKPDEPGDYKPYPAKRSRFIHLEKVRTYAPGRPQLAVTSSLWRGNIAEVKGFSLGYPPPPESK